MFFWHPYHPCCIFTTLLHPLTYIIGTNSSLLCGRKRQIASREVPHWEGCWCWHQQSWRICWLLEWLMVDYISNRMIYHYSLTPKWVPNIHIRSDHPSHLLLEMATWILWRSSLGMVQTSTKLTNGLVGICIDESWLEQQHSIFVC